MRRYKTYPLQEREFIKVSYIPRELELIWSLIIGVWVTVVLSQEIIIPSYTFWENFRNMLVLMLVLWANFIFISIGFSRGFRSGNLNAYAFIVWTTFLTSLVLIDNYFKSLNLNGLNAILTLKVKIIWIFFCTLIPVLFFLLMNISYRAISLLKGIDPSNKGLKWWIAILGIISSTFLIGLLIIIYSQWQSFMKIMKFNEVLDLLAKDSNYPKVHFRTLMIFVINILVLLRVLGTEVFYMFNTMKLKIRAEILD